MSLATQISALATRIAQEVKLKADKTDPRFTGSVSADRLPLVPGVPVSGSATTSLAINAASGNIWNVTSTTATLAVGAPTNPTDRQIIRLAVYRSSGVTVNFDAGYKLSTGISSRSVVVPSGQVLFAALEYSSLNSTWTITALTVSA